MVETAANSDNTRRLMAIMFTDIKGYSSMMGADESATVELVLEHREIVRACIADHEGHEHETIGDAFVVLFESVVNAVRCSIDVQQRLSDRNAPLPEDKQVWIRIGVHLGDIILREGGIYGDAVNMAARVQDRGQPGGVCITEQVKMHIKGRIDTPMISMGVPPLKGIAHPPELYALDLPTARGPLTALPVAESAANGRKLVAAAAVVILAVGAAFAFNASRSSANGKGSDASVSANGKPAANAGVTAPVKPPTPDTETKAPPAPAAAKNPEVAAAKVAEKTNLAAEKRMAADLVTAANVATGPERVELLTEALKHDPGNHAYQLLLKQAQHQVSRERTRRAARRTAHASKSAHAKAAPAVSPPKAAALPKPTISRHVVED